MSRNRYRARKVRYVKFYDIMRQQYCYEIRCPKCNDRILILEFLRDRERRFPDFREFYKYCSLCGQKLEWSEVYENDK